jgi:hypothetical protein
MSRPSDPIKLEPVTLSGRFVRLELSDTVYFSIINTEWPVTKARFTSLRDGAQGR